MGLRKVNTKEDWIKIKDKLPDKNQRVLVYRSKQYDNKIEISFYSTLSTRWMGDSFYNVTHWMPLPEHPND